MVRSTATIQYVRVDHRGLDVLVPQQLLHSANVVPARLPEIPALAAGHPNQTALATCESTISKIVAGFAI